MAEQLFSQRDWFGGATSGSKSEEPHHSKGATSSDCSPAVGCSRKFSAGSQGSESVGSFKSESAGSFKSGGFEERVLHLLESIDYRLSAVEKAEQKVLAASAHKASNRKGRSAYQDLLEGNESINSASLNAIVQNLESSAARHELKSSSTMHMTMHDDGTIEARSAVIHALTCKCLKRVRTIHPGGKLRFRWDLVHLVALQASVIIAPLRLAFPDYFHLEPLWLAAEVLLDVLFCMGTVLCAFTSYKKPYEAQYVTEPAKVIQHYFFTWGVPDTLSSLPLGPAAMLCGARAESWPVVLARILKLLRFAKLTVLLRELRSSKRAQKALENIDPALVILLQISFTIFVFWHWVACIWWFLSTTTLPGACCLGPPEPTAASPWTAADCRRVPLDADAARCRALRRRPRRGRLRRRRRAPLLC